MTCESPVLYFASLQLAATAFPGFDRDFTPCELLPSYGMAEIRALERSQMMECAVPRSVYEMATREFTMLGGSYRYRG